MPEALICDAIRTPFGRYGGTLSTVRTDDLAALHGLTGRHHDAGHVAVARGHAVAVLQQHHVAVVASPAGGFDRAIGRRFHGRAVFGGSSRKSSGGGIAGQLVRGILGSLFK